MQAWKSSLFLTLLAASCVSNNETPEQTPAYGASTVNDLPVAPALDPAMPPPIAPQSTEKTAQPRRPDEFLLDGIWEGACETKGKNSEQKTAMFHSFSYRSITKHFSDKRCKKLSHELIEEAGVQSNVVKDRHDDKAQGVFALVVQKISLIPHDPKTMDDLFNKSKLCGFDDWQKEIAKEVNGLQCGEITYANAGDNKYESYVKTGEKARFAARAVYTLEDEIPEEIPLGEVEYAYKPLPAL